MGKLSVMIEFRICLDPRPLNKAIQRKHFQLPTTATGFEKSQLPRTIINIQIMANSHNNVSKDVTTCYLLTISVTMYSYI